MKNWTTFLIIFIGAISMPAFDAYAVTYTGALNASNISKLRPGDTLQVPFNDITSETIVWGIQGTSQNPITIKGLPSASGQLPVFEDSVIFYDAGNIIFDGFAVRNSYLPGIVIEQGAGAITVQNSNITNNMIGVWIGNGAGTANHILNNKIYSNTLQGIAIALVDNVPGQETVIQGNQIYRNGAHGVEINGNYYIVNNNVVWGNGLSVPGSSGIHVYSKTATQGEGQHNTITYNVSYQNKDNAVDGNGIEIDQWCDHNLVAFNVAYQNDGAGIILFDSADNSVYNNTLYANAQDPALSHPYKGDLVLATDYVHDINHTTNNNIFNNLIYTNANDAVPVYVDQLTSANNNVIGNQDLFNANAQGNLYFWDNAYGTGIQTWNSLKTGNPDFQLNPQFTNLNVLPSGLILANNSPLIQKGSALSAVSTVDLAGVTINTLSPPIGAYSNTPVITSNSVASSTALSGQAIPAAPTLTETDLSCGPHPAGTFYTIAISKTLVPRPATKAECPYGGTAVFLVTTNQEYSCSDGTPVAQGPAVSTVSNKPALLTCNEPDVRSRIRLK